MICLFRGTTCLFVCGRGGDETHVFKSKQSLSERKSNKLFEGSNQGQNWEEGWKESELEGELQTRSLTPKSLISFPRTLIHSYHY